MTVQQQDLGRRRIALFFCSEYKEANQLHIYCAADLRLCSAYAKSSFSHEGVQLVVRLS